MSAPAAKPVNLKIERVTLQTNVADLSNAAIIAACGLGEVKDGQVDAYLTMTCALGDFHVHIHACATRIEGAAPPAVKH